MIPRLPIIRAGIVALLFASPVAANDPESPAPGQARSMSFSPLAPDLAVAVRPLDNSRANMTLKQHFDAALKKRSVHVQEMPAPYVLNFETEVEQTIRHNVPTLATAAGSNHGAGVHISIWSSQHGSTLRGRASEIDRGLLRYMLTATLDDERTGRRLWQGEATYTGAPADEAATLAGMASILADQIGQTVRQRSFRIE